MQKLTVEEQKHDSILEGEKNLQKIEMERKATLRMQKKMGSTANSFAVLKDNYDGKDAAGKD